MFKYFDISTNGIDAWSERLKSTFNYVFVFILHASCIDLRVSLCVYKQAQKNSEYKNQQTFDLTCCTILNTSSQVELRRMFTVFIQEMSVFNEFHSSWLSVIELLAV